MNKHSQKIKYATSPGINQKARIDFLSEEEIKIVNKFAKKYWYITNVTTITSAKSNYRVVFLKPVDYITQNFNLTREVVLIFSPYAVFEPRTLDILDNEQIRITRLEEICCLIASKDSNIATSLNSFMKSNTESRVIVPFSYTELLDSDDDEFIINKMRSYFYSRDLFGIQDPLKKEFYFFGRRDLIQELVNKHFNDENAGIFGLRKTGKTSIIYGVMRTLDRKKSFALLIDCQTLHLLPWNLALQRIIWQLVTKLTIKQTSFKERRAKYEDLRQAAFVFEEDMMEILTKSKKNILFIFDEIENITFDTSASEDWKNGDSFLKFWQTIRSFAQHNQSKQHFSYLIAGTNPRCVETPSIAKTDNPIFAQFTPIYISPFNFDYTEEMLSRLGGYMGLRFDKSTIADLVNDFGGHPLLMRQMASYIHKKVNNVRPVLIKRHEYHEYKKQFYQDEMGFNQYAVMILQVLHDWYIDEYEMLKLLAQGDIEDFRVFADDPTYITHLKNYGIIEADNTKIGYHFKIEALQEFLTKKLKYKKQPTDNVEIETEIQNKLSAIEKALRRMVKRQLKSALGEKTAKEEIIRLIYRPKAIQHYTNHPYGDFFDPNKHEIYLKTLLQVILRNYDHFKNLFDVQKDEFNSKAELLNKYRQVPAHAKSISTEDFSIFRSIAGWFEKILEEE